jgi:rubrerythrin
MSCLNCKIKNCFQIKKGLQFCYMCPNYPWATLEHLDARYRTRYNVSAEDNLMMIKVAGLVEFVAAEGQKWICPVCGGTISMHTGICNNCQKSQV